MTVDVAKLQQMLMIARTGNFTRAAEELGMTQPALSRNISLLEQRYGLKIFDRGRGGASLTPLGQQIVEQAKFLVQQATILEKNIQLYGRGEGGQINLGVGPQLAGLILPRLGVHMLATRPHVRMQYTLKTVDLMLPQLWDGSMDMIVCAIANLPPSPEVIIESLGALKLGILARAGHPLAGHSNVKMTDLALFPLAIESGRLPPSFPPYSGGLSCENSHILRDIVLGSDALWFSSPEIVDCDIAAGMLVEIDVVDLPFRHVEVGIVKLARRDSSPAMTAVAEFVRDFLGGSVAEHTDS